MDNPQNLPQIYDCNELQRTTGGDRLDLQEFDPRSYCYNIISKRGKVCGKSPHLKFLKSTGYDASVCNPMPPCRLKRYFGPETEAKLKYDRDDECIKMSDETPKEFEKNEKGRDEMEMGGKPVSGFEGIYERSQVFVRNGNVTGREEQSRELLIPNEEIDKKRKGLEIKKKKSEPIIDYEIPEEKFEKNKNVIDIEENNDQLIIGNEEINENERVKGEKSNKRELGKSEKFEAKNEKIAETVIDDIEKGTNENEKVIDKEKKIIEPSAIGNEEFEEITYEKESVIAFKKSEEEFEGRIYKKETGTGKKKRSFEPVIPVEETQEEIDENEEVMERKEMSLQPDVADREPDANKNDVGIKEKTSQSVITVEETEEEIYENKKFVEGEEEILRPVIDVIEIKKQIYKTETVMERKEKSPQPVIAVESGDEIFQNENVKKDVEIDENGKLIGGQQMDREPIISTEEFEEGIDSKEGEMSDGLATSSSVEIKKNMDGKKKVKGRKNKRSKVSIGGKKTTLGNDTVLPESPARYSEAKEMGGIPAISATDSIRHGSGGTDSAASFRNIFIDDSGEEKYLRNAWRSSIPTRVMDASAEQESSLLPENNPVKIPFASIEQQNSSLASERLEEEQLLKNNSMEVPTFYDGAKAHSRKETLEYTDVCDCLPGFCVCGSKHFIFKRGIQRPSAMDKLIQPELASNYGPPMWQESEQEISVKSSCTCYHAWEDNEESMEVTPASSVHKETVHVPKKPRRKLVRSQPTFQKTVIIVKPEATNFKDVIIRAIKKAGLDIINERLVQLSPEQVAEVYSENYGSAYFPMFVQKMSSTPILVLAVAGSHAIDRWKYIIGQGEVMPSSWFYPESIKRRFGVHCDIYGAMRTSTDFSTAKNELRYFFPLDIIEPIIIKSAEIQDYCDKYIHPTLLKALYKVIKEKPENPFLFLAEWLLRNNPFQPFYRDSLLALASI